MSSEYQNLPPATRQAVMSAAEAIAPEQSAQDVRESLSVTDKGKTANTIDNCRIVFCCDPLLRDAIRLNLLTDRVDIVRDLGWRRNTSALTDTDVKYLLLYFEQNYELTSEKKITAPAPPPRGFQIDFLLSDTQLSCFPLLYVFSILPINFFLFVSFLSQYVVTPLASAMGI